MLRIKSEIAEVWYKALAAQINPWDQALCVLGLKETKSVVLALEELSNLIFHITVNCHFIHFH